MKKILENQTLRKFLRNKKAVFGVIVVALLVLAVLLIPLFMDLDPYTTDRTAGFNARPSSSHILGTDDVGRDLFARLLYGGRVSLFVGITSTIISVLIGIPLGLIAGYFRGKAESVIMRVADAFMSFPSMVLILVLVAVFGPSILTVTVVIGILGWTAIAKLIYGNVLSIREQEYIQAARAIGMKTGPILLTEVLPNAIPPVWANISFRVAGAILTESSLSFLGMGVQTPQASWGARGAASWESADDGMAAIFHLDENATWHDGEPVTAEDWVFTAQLITDPDFPFGLKSEFNSWAGTTDAGIEESENSVMVEALDDYTLKMTFKTVTPVEDWLLLHNKYYYVLPEHLLGDIAPADMMSDSFWNSPIGSGPCTFISEISGSELQLGSFADYQLGAPKFGKLVSG